MKTVAIIALLFCATVASGQVIPVNRGGTGAVTAPAARTNLGVTVENILPAQTGQNGKVLGTNGTIASWGNIFPSQTGQSGRVLGTNGTTVSWVIGGVDSGGGVTSVDMSVPSTLLTITGNPITTFGTLTVGLATQSSNSVFASPSNGSSGAPLFRSLVAADIPNLPASKISSGTLAIAQGGTNLSSSGASGNYLRSNGSVWTSSAIQAADVPTLNQSTTGSAATLTTPRNINGVAFDGSGNITVPAAAGTLTGSTLAGTVTASSLTSVGALANLTVTNPIVGSVTGTAADLSATLSIAKGGTGQTTANTALNALLPTQTSQSGKFLTTDGTNTSWATGGGGGAVSSVSNLDGTVTISPTTGAVVVSLPTVAVGTGGTGVTTLATNGVLYGNSSSAIQALAVNATGTNKLLTQSSSGAPAWATLVSGDIPNNAANTTGSAATWTTARNLAGNSVDGSANVAFTNKFIVQGTTDAGLSSAQFLGALGTGIVKNTTTTGVLSIAVAGDFPTLNQSTTGSAATLTTPRAIYGNNFDGSAALSQIIASAYGGTGNGFTKFSGPATSEKTFTLPNASATVLTDNAAVTVAQGGTGLATITAHDVLVGAGTSNVVPVSPSTSGFVLTSNGTSSDPSFQVLPGSSSGANPTATLGLTAVNGSASTFMRSDAAPALDVSITPTWSGLHTFSQAVGTGLTNGVLISNPTAATVGAPKYSPALDFRANGWKTNSTASSKAVDFFMQNQTVDGAASPFARLVTSVQMNGGTAAPLMKLGLDGFLTLQDTSGVQPFQLTGAWTRPGITSVAVPSFRAATANTACFLDVFPNGIADPAATFNNSAVDIVDTDLVTYPSARYHALHLAVRHGLTAGGGINCAEIAAVGVGFLGDPLWIIGRSIGFADTSYLDPVEKLVGYHNVTTTALMGGISVHSNAVNADPWGTNNWGLYSGYNATKSYYVTALTCPSNAGISFRTHTAGVEPTAQSSFTDGAIFDGASGSFTINPGQFVQQHDAIGVVHNTGIQIKNTTAATVGVPLQISPDLLFINHVWGNGADSLRQGRISLTATSQSNPTCTLLFDLGNPNIGYTTGMSISSAGVLTLGAPLTVSNGGTGTSTLTGVLHGNGTSAVTAANVNLTSEITGTLPVANGGTSFSSYTTGDIPYASGSTTLAKLAAGTAGYVVTSNGTGVAPTYQAPQIGGQWIYGNGNDGTVYFDGATTPVAGATLSGSTYTLTRDIAAGNLTVSNGVTVKTAGRSVYATGTLLDSGTIDNSGNSASGATAGAVGGGGAFGTFGAGAAGRTTNGNGLTVSAGLDAMGGSGGNGGAAGSGGFTGGSGSIASSSLPIPYAGTMAFTTFSHSSTTVRQIIPGQGGGGGGLNISTGSPTSGAGGSGGGVIMISAHTITVVSVGAIKANGGTGSAAALVGGTGDAGGGGGGGGGIVWLYSDSYTNNGTVQANGGSGGSAIGLGSAGATGSNGLVIFTANSTSGYLGTSVNLATQVTGLMPLANGGTNASLAASNGGILYTTSTQGAVLPIGTTGQSLQVVAGIPSWRSANFSQASPVNPTGTSDATGKMMGLAGAITPTTSGTVLVTITGGLTSGATGNPEVQIRYGTGTAPTNGAALTGTTAGSSLPEGGIASSTVPFGGTAIISGLTLLTAYWIDVSLKSDGTSTASIKNLSITAYEVK